MRVLLVCQCGMSAYVLANKMMNSAKILGVDNFFIQGKSSVRLEENLGRFDLCLTGPQVKYALEGIKANLKIPVEVISKDAYRCCDGEKILKQAIYLYRNKIIW